MTQARPEGERGGTTVTPPAAGVQRFAGFRRTVADLNRAVDFYCAALGFDCGPIEICVVADGADLSCADIVPARRARLRLGDETIELYAPAELRSRPGARRPAHAVNSTGFQHIAVVAADMASAYARLQRHAPHPISRGAPVRLPANADGVVAYKFRDVDGHPVELIAFPEGVGDPRWQRARGADPTLGIDHSAIGVADVGRSIDFYVRALGFRVVSRQLNTGVEQDRLDGASGVRVDVVALAPAGHGTPHLELLGYRVPAPLALAAEPAPSADAADRLVWTVGDVQAITSGMFATRPKPADASLRIAAGAAGDATLRDPDGHGLLLRQAMPQAASPREIWRI